MRLTPEEYNNLMIELVTTTNYLKSLKPTIESSDEEHKLNDAIKALEKLTLV